MAITCPSCGKISPDSAASCDCGYEFAPVPHQTPPDRTISEWFEGRNRRTPEPHQASTLNRTRKCPFCAEEILSEAKKCKHCGEFLNGSRPSARDGGETVGVALLLVPLAAVFLIWFWIGQMNLLQSPGSSLAAVACLTVILTAGLAASEAGRIKTETSPVAWFVAFLFLWVIAYPAYLFNRRKYGRKNLLFSGLVVAGAFAGSVVLLSMSIESQRQNLRESFDRAGSGLGALTGSGKADSEAAPSKPLEVEPQLELVKYTWHDEYGYAILEGQVTNISSQTLANVTALASFYDADNSFITSADALIDYNPILPGQTSPFKVSTNFNPAMKRAGVVFKELTGGTIPFRTAAIKKPAKAEPLVTFVYPKETISTNASSVREVDFRNFTYAELGPNPVTRRFSLVSGKGMETRAGGIRAGFTGVRFGYLTGSETEDAAVILWETGGGSGGWGSVYLYALRDGQLALLAGFQTGDRADRGLRRLTMEGGELILDLNELGEGPMCCPKTFTRSRYKWTEGQLVQNGEARRESIN